MTRLRFAWRFLFVGCFLSVATCALTARGDIPQKQIEELENVFLPAYEQGNTRAVLESMSNVVRRLTPDQLDELDQMLTQQGIPVTSELLVNTRLTLLQQNAKQRLPKPGIRELVAMLEHIDQEITNVQTNLDHFRDGVTNASNAESFGKYESLIWDAHVLGQQLEGSIGLSDYAATLLKNKKRLRTDNLRDSEKPLFEIDFDSRSKQLAEAAIEVEEQDLVLRIRRLTFARNVLEFSEDLAKKYMAAWSVVVDGESIQNALKSKPKDHEFKTESLNEDSLPDDIDLIVKEGTKLAGKDLLAKSRLLFEGLHWWMRGRYGMGTDAFGLLKSPEAVVSEEREFALFMPVATPTPTVPSETSRHQIPEIDRRHNYIWAWEYRKLQYGTSSHHQKISSTPTGLTQETTLSRFY